MDTPTITATNDPAQSKLVSGLLEKIIVASDHGKPTPSYSSLRTVYCLEQKCPKEVDWLLFQPTAIPLWVIGGMMLTLGLVATIRYRRKKYFRFTFTYARITSIALGLAMMLRASVTLMSGNLVALYAASIYFNYVAGIFAYYSLCKGVIQIITLFQPPTSSEKRLMYFLHFVIRFSPQFLLIFGVAFMFHPVPKDSVTAGIQCIRTTLAIVIAVTLGIALSFAYQLSAMRKHMDKQVIASTFVTAFLVEMWALFMFARSFVGISSVARTSEVVFWMLDYLPIIVQCLVAIALGDPITEKKQEEKESSSLSSTPTGNNEIQPKSEPEPVKEHVERSVNVGGMESGYVTRDAFYTDRPCLI
ncbi:hypothetical protein IWW48_005580 [Coemansia sp. RSA 1200]|nr:hypothetical protein IWW48_005580 [Coemansia sp. RSA 1200]